MKAGVRLCCSAVVVLLLSSFALSQSLTTGAINGTIIDSSGGAIPGAIVVATNTKTGAQRTTMSGGTGLFVLAQLDPGEYTLTAQAQGFKRGQLGVVTVSVSRVASFQFRLQVGAVSEKVEVSAEVPLIEPSNPNTNLTLSATQLGNVPNPGNDLAYAANFAPGVVLATTTSAGSFTTGSFEANGLPSVANDFTIDGLDANDPVSNVNVTGASGLQLGLNAVQEVSVNTLSYSVDQGRLGASQLNYVTKSGTNGFHGNAFETWNGSAMNARNFFLNAFGEQRKPRSNVNQFGASVGGPLVKDKVFFFADVEGIRLVLPVVLTSTLPSPAFQDYVLQQLPMGGTDSFGFPLPPQPEEMPFYHNMFLLMEDTSRGVPLEMFGCPFDVGGVTPPAIPNDGNGCANKRTFSASPSPGASETLFTFKLDYNHSAKDTFWLRFQMDNGKQQTSVDPVNSLFDVGATVPVRSSAAGWTRVFNPHLVNQFNPGFTYRAFRQDLADPVKARAALAIQLYPSGFSTIGNNLSLTPGGPATTIWQLTDNLAWSRGRHSATFGANFRSVLVTQQNSLAQVPLVFQFSLEEFIFGAAAQSTQFFRVKTEDRERWANLDIYAMDTVRVTDKLTLSAGVRATWNSNLVSADKLFSRLRGSFSTISHDINRPLNLDIVSRQATFFPATRLIQWAPRVGVAYELRPKTVLRAGAGFFGQPPEGALTSNLLQNAPTLTRFDGGLFNSVGGIGIAPGVPNSAIDVLASANQQFQAAYSSGGLSCASPNAPPSSCLPAVGYNVFDPGSHDQWLYPYSIQWSGGVERQLGNDLGVTVKYVGTHSLRGLYTEYTNAYQFACPGCFSPLPFGNAPDPRFGQVFTFHPGANSSYHSLQTTLQKRMSRGLSFQANYTYSHCLDTQSNFGDLLFNAGAGYGAALGSLATQRGNCDYDIRHSLNGFYLYELPFRFHRAWLNSIVGGWGLSGSLFLRGGFPFTVRSFFAGEIANGFPVINADHIAGRNPYAKGNVPGAGIQWLNPNAFQSIIDPNTFACFPVDSPQNCRDGNSGRNTIRGPDFRWSDFSIGKRISIAERLTLRLDAQFYNLFNHPNFGFPQSSIGFGDFGVISTTVSPGTGLLGAGLGGDTSGRMISLRGRIEF